MEREIYIRFMLYLNKRLKTKIATQREKMLNFANFVKSVLAGEPLRS